MSATVIFIHGANSTSSSFNYIKSCCHFNNVEDFDYSVQQRFFLNLTNMTERLSFINGPIFFIAHSLGGIFALLLADQFSDRVKGAVTISTPYGGSSIADFIKFLVPNNQFFREIGPCAEPIAQSKQIQIRWPWVNIVTTRGHVPWIPGDNDGVVTLDSMRNHHGMDIVDVASNHYEVLLNNQVVDIIKQRTGTI